jgi:hypothetical protein
MIHSGDATVGAAAVRAELAALARVLASGPR